MENKLMINCATCDARGVQEENYAHYEQITINCAMLLTSPGAKLVMNKLPATVNCANVLELEEKVDFRTINGSSEIRQGDTVPDGKYFMIVNGALTIGPGTQKQLAQCVGMNINGSLTCPESIYPLLQGVKVNGSTTCYPDGAIVLKNNAVIDKLFALRAKNSLYWCKNRMIMVDPELDADKLKAKGATFSAAEMILCESKVEALIDIIDEKTQIVIVPDGTAVIVDDVELDDTLLRKYGNQLYVIGDVVVPKDAGTLDKLRYLNVYGDIKVHQENKEKLLEVLTAVSGEIKIDKPRGAVLEDKPFVKITKWMLEQQPLGLEVSDCAIVQMAHDIPKELIVQRLRIYDCGVVSCSEDMEDAVTMICSGVGHIGAAAGEGTGIGDMIKNALGGAAGLMGTKVINAADYIL